MSFQAKYDGRCAACKETIYEGDMLEYVDGDVVHLDCVPDHAKEQPKRPVCPNCWQEIPLTGVCGNCT